MSTSCLTLNYKVFIRHKHGQIQGVKVQPNSNKKAKNKITHYPESEMSDAVRFFIFKKYDSSI